jgi:dTDP-4-amino-4,6-dideoxygalactose transaminase
MKNEMTRRKFVAAASAGAVAFGGGFARAADKPAVLGGKPVRTAPFPSWPMMDARDEEAVMGVLRSGRWYRGGGQKADEFERLYAKMTGAKCCLATANGTSSLIISLVALDIGPGDEVIVPPFTFVATINAVLMVGALPVFVDTDLETFLIDAHKIEAAINERTKALLPVHIGGSAADLDAILAIGRKRNLPVIEDACQAHMGEWRGRKLGSLGTTGCFSFQVTKNLSSGEGGAILTNDEDLLEKCYAFHNNSHGRKAAGRGFNYWSRGANLRMTEFQAALLMAQMARIEAQTRTRDANAQYLTSLLKQIPGIQPAAMYEGCTMNAHHLYMSRYRQEQFAGLPRANFLRALSREGVPCGRGYDPLNKEPFLTSTLQSRGYQAAFGKERLARWEKENNCPVNDTLCTEAFWFTQPMLLGPRSDMDQIAEAIRKIQANAAEIAHA